MVKHLQAEEFIVSINVDIQKEIVRKYRIPHLPE